MNLLTPYPNYQSNLVRERHMYVCRTGGTTKEVLLCITRRVKHLRRNFRPIKRVTITPDQYHEKSPFTRPTLVDCDTGLLIENLVIPNALLTQPPSICEEFLNAIYTETSIGEYSRKDLSREEMLMINPDIKAINNF